MEVLIQRLIDRVYGRDFSMFEKPLTRLPTRKEAIQKIREFWHRIPKNQEDPAYEMLSVELLMHLTRSELDAYNDNLCIRREISQNESKARFENIKRRLAYKVGNKEQGHKSYLRIRLYKSVAYKQRIAILETPFLKSSGWFYSKS